MKQLLVTSYMVMAICCVCMAQSPGTIKTRNDRISDRIVLQKKDHLRIQLYRVFSEYFTENNIYPNADAIDLVDAYNKQLTYEDIETRRKQLRPFILTPPSNEMKARVKDQPVLVIRNDVMPATIFKTGVEAFNQRQQALAAGPGADLPASFRDSLLTARNRTLPAISNATDKIPRVQMEFFIVTLQDINQMMDELARLPNQPAIRQSIIELMDDFFTYNPAGVQPMMRNSPNASTSLYQNQFLFAAYAPEPAGYDPGSQPPGVANANIYVYTRGANGLWDQAPKPFSYNVYYGANGLIYSLKPGCDTLSFFKFRPTAPASTLPVFLAKGNYCFVLQDVNKPHRIFLKPGINLRDNQLIDDQQLIKLCFKVEN